MIETTGIPKGKSGVYRIYCKETGMAYIGQSKNIRRRLGEHKSALIRNNHRNKQMQNEYNAYGPDSFLAEVLVYADDGLDEIEVSYIEHARENNKCYNVFSGGKTGYTVTQEFRDAISRAHKGRKVSDETKRLMSDKTRRQWKNASYRDLMTESAKRQWEDDTYREIMHKAHTGRSDACGHKLTPQDVLEMRIRYSNGESATKLAEEFGVKYCAAKDAISGRSWRNI